MATENQKTVGDDMRQRRTFYPERNEAGEITTTALDSALAYLGKCQEDFSDFASFPFAAPGLGQDSDGNAEFDGEVYNDSVGIMIGVLKKAKVGAKAVFMGPIPDFPAAIEGGEDVVRWITSIMEKEANHVMVRALRDAEDVSTVVDQMPASVEAYTTSGRGITSGVMIAFNELYKPINAALAARVTTWARARLIKSELKNCFESAGYATEYYPQLEDRGDDPSLFETALQLGINAAKKQGLDSTIFERWLATRDQKAFTADADESDDEALDLDALTDSLLEDDAEVEEVADDSAEESTNSEA